MFRPSIAALFAAALLTGAPHAVFARNLYWSNRAQNKIQRVAIETMIVEDVVDTLSEPHGVFVDTVNGKVYWYEALFIRVVRANLDGSNVEVVVQIPFAARPAAASPPHGTVAVDAIGGSLYVLETAIGAVYRANLDGSAIDLYDPPSAHVFGLGFDTQRGSVFWTQVGGDPCVCSGTPNGAAQETIVATGGFGLAVDPQSEFAYFFSTSPRKIERVAYDGTQLATLVLDVPTGPELVQHLAVDPDEGKLYWIGTDGIRRANIDGTNVEDFITSSGVVGPLSVYGLALDLPPLPAGDGACCDTTEGLGGPCVEDVLWTACQQASDVFHYGVACAAIACDPSSGGACCTATPPFAPCTDSQTVSFFNRQHCEDDFAGTWFPGSSCTDNPCTQPMGACCFASTGLCLDPFTQIGCDRFDGVAWHGGATCATSPCVPFCTPTDTFADIVAPFGGSPGPNFLDISAVTHCFRGLPIAPPSALCDLHPCWPTQDRCVGDGLIDFLDISRAVNAFKGFGCQ